MKKVKRLRLAGAAFTCVSLLALWGTAAKAQSVPVNEPNGINLGGTSFFDGLGSYKPGFIYEQYFQYFHFNAINGSNGEASPAFKGTSISSTVSLNQLIYVSPYHLFGGVLGLTALQPFTDLNASFANDSPAKLEANTGTGVGDLTWGPFLAFPPIMHNGRPIFAHRFEFDVISPTGSYNPSLDINPSSGYWSIAPYWAMTVLPTAKTEISARFNYLHNFVNNDPASSMPLPLGTTTKAGDAGWVNFTASYEFFPKFNAGLNGYYFKQFTGNQVDGVTQDGGAVENLSLGAGATYAFDRNNIGFFNFYLPVKEVNTTSGFHLVLRFVHVF